MFHAIVRVNAARAIRISVILGVFLSACSTRKAQVPVMRPALVNLSTYPTIAIVPFAFEQSSQPESLVELINSKLSNRESKTDPAHIPVFHGSLIVAQPPTSAVKNGQESSGYHRNANLGNANLGLDVARHFYQVFAKAGIFQMANERARESTLVLTGRIIEHDSKETLKQKTERNRQGVDITRTTRVTHVRLDVTVQLIDTNMKTVVFERDMSCNQQRSTSSVDGTPPPIVTDELFQDCKQVLAAQFVTLLRPHEEKVALKFADDKALLGTSEGVALAEQGKWESSIRVFKRIVEQARNSPKPVLAKALWNLGLVLAYSYHLDEARAVLQRAHEVDPDTNYDREIETLEQLTEDFEQLRAAGMVASRS